MSVQTANPNTVDRGSGGTRTRFDLHFLSATHARTNDIPTLLVAFWPLISNFSRLAPWETYLHSTCPPQFFVCADPALTKSSSAEPDIASPDYAQLPVAPYHFAVLRCRPFSIKPALSLVSYDASDISIRQRPPISCTPIRYSCVSTHPPPIFARVIINSPSKDSLHSPWCPPRLEAGLSLWRLPERRATMQAREPPLPLPPIPATASPRQRQSTRTATILRNPRSR